MLACRGCGGLFADISGPTHAYMLSSPGCWAAYGRILAREYSDPSLFASSHRLTVDAYALQHPGLAEDRRAVQSVTVHFASLHAVFDMGWDHARARALLQRIAKRDFAPLPAAPTFGMTAADLNASSVADHHALVERWARAAYDAWSPLLGRTAQSLIG